MPSEPSAPLAAGARYAYLASAVAGRRLQVRESMGVEPLAYCDGRMILLPRGSGSEQNSWMAVVAQALLVAGGSLALPVLRRLVGRPQAARRYAYLEVRRAMARRNGRVPHGFSRHPALTLDLAGGEPGDAEDSARYALDFKVLLPEIPDFIGSVRPMATMRNLLRSDGLAALTAKQREQAEHAADTPPEQSDDEETEESNLLKLFENPLMGKNPLSNMLKRLIGMSASRGKENPDSGGGSEMRVAGIARAWQRGVHAVKAVLASELPDFDAGGASPQFTYPEWNEAGRKYRQNWVHIEEVDAWRADGPGEPGELSHVLTALPRELQRQLAALGLDYEMHRRQLDGAEFDVGRLIETAIDIRAGHSPAAMDIYRSSRKTRRDLGVMVVLDLSGSTEEKNARGESVFEHQLRTAWHLTQAFDRLGDRVALYGFQSWGRKLVRMVRLKGHEEPWSGHVAERFALVEPQGYTRTGAAIRHADQILRKSMRLPNRLMILITDGLSYDQDYEEHYAEADTRKALAEARAEGTACICLCIGGSLSVAQLKAVFGFDNLLMVDDAAQVTGQIRAVAMTALRGVSKRKVARITGAVSNK